MLFGKPFFDNQGYQETKEITHGKVEALVTPATLNAAMFGNE
jgi:hypothetical protein